MLLYYTLSLYYVTWIIKYYCKEINKDTSFITMLIFGASTWSTAKSTVNVNVITHECNDNENLGCNRWTTHHIARFSQNDVAWINTWENAFCKKKKEMQLVLLVGELMRNARVEGCGDRNVWNVIKCIRPECTLSLTVLCEYAYMRH